MPSASKRRPVLLELPPGLTLAQLQTTINDRFRELNNLFDDYVFQPADADVDIGTSRIVNLADPKNDLDGVNLRTLRKFQGAPATQEVSSTGLDAYAIAITTEGFAANGLMTPAYDVNHLREGDMVCVSFSALTAGSVQASIINPVLINSAGVQSNILTEPLTLPIGQTAAVYSVKFALTGLSKGMKVVNVFTQAGDAQNFTATIVVRRR